MASLQDLRSAAARIVGNMALGTPWVTAVNTGGAATFKTTNAILHLKNGKPVSRAALSAVALTAPTTSTTDVYGTAMSATEAARWALYTAPAGATFYIVLALDGASTANAVAFQGSYAAFSTTAAQDLTFRGMPLQKGDSLIPQIPDGFIPFAIIKVNYASAFVPGTTALDVSGVTFADYGILPSTTTL